MIRLFLFTAMILGMMSMPSYAADQTPSAKDPLEISADDALEWDRAQKKFTARGNALAKQGDVSIVASTLTAFYRDNEKSNFDLYTVVADKNVVIHSADNKAYGEKAVYNLDKDYAELTGNDLRIETAEQTITARDKFEYFVSKGEFKAVGQAKIVRPQDMISADVITARMYTDKRGKRVLSKVIAQGNVMIETAEERVTGARGIYNARTNMVDLTGGVVITRGVNILKGESAHVNLNTLVSKLYGAGSGAKNKGRVSGTFYPDSMKSK